MRVRVSRDDSSRNGVRRSTGATAALCAAALLAGQGCGAVFGLFSGQKQAEARQVELTEQQARVMRFADELAARVTQAGATVERAVAATPGARLELQEWRLGQITSAFIIAAGENPVVNGLDMIVLTTLEHAVMRDYWTPRYGAAVRPLVDAHAVLEREAWSLNENTLSSDQARELRLMIDEWRRDNPKVRSVGFIHFRDFSSTIGKQRGGGARSPSLFGLVGLDPFAGIDPAVRELARNRLLAERALFYGQRLPYLLDMQVVHVAYQSAAMPETRQVLGDVNMVSASVERATATLDGLPQLLAHEREAAIDQIVQRLEEQQEHATVLLNDARLALEAGTAAAIALDRTVHSVDALVARFEKGDDSKPSEPPAKPFDIDAYVAAATELSRAARDGERLVSTLGRTAPQLTASVRAISDASTGVIDHAFARAVALLLVALLGGLAAAVAYRWAAIKLRR